VPTFFTPFAPELKVHLADMDTEESLKWLRTVTVVEPAEEG